jgi:2-dehydropantoate 2-reductase
LFNQKPLKLLVVGAGAIGGYIGASLVLQGHSVVFLCRPKTAAVLREQGLTLTGPAGTHSITPVIVSSVAEALSQDSYDAWLLSVKSYDTVEVIQEFLPFRGQLPPVLSLQNGIANESRLKEAFGDDQVLPGTVTTAVGRPEPGKIQIEKLRGVGISGDLPIARSLVEAMKGAGLNARYYPDAASMKWSKLLTNLLANPTSAILDMSPLEIFQDKDLFSLEIRQLREALAVMKKIGASVVDLPGTPVRALAFAAAYLPLVISRPLLYQAVGKGRGAKMPSFHIDLHHGRGQTEVDYLHGAVVASGERFGIPTPVNRLLRDTLNQLVEGALPVAEYQRAPEKLISQLPR